MAEIIALYIPTFVNLHNYSYASPHVLLCLSAHLHWPCPCSHVLALQLQLSGVLLRLWRLLCLQSRRVKANRQVWVAALAVQQTSSSTTGTRSTRGRCGSSGARCRHHIARTAHPPSPAPLSGCFASCSRCCWSKACCPRCWALPLTHDMSDAALLADLGVHP